MNIEFINHACFLVEHRGIRLLTDPWLFGSAFNDGWDLLCDYEYDMDQFENIDYIWFSHEHPDHFSPAVLKKIKEAHRKEITVLFQETKDKKVVKFCEKMGFKTQELPNHKKVTIAEGFSVQCGKVLYFDSWLCFYLDNTKILNINDCMVDGDIKADAVKKHTGEVDVLLTQFSRVASAASKLEVMKTQMQVLAPKYTIPFASYIYFSHEENKFMNDGINKPEAGAEAIVEGKSLPIVMYPGDSWTIASEWDNQPAFDKYQADYAQIDNKKYHKSKASLTEQELIASADRYLERMRKNNNFFMVKTVKAIGIYKFFEPFRLYVHDLDQTYLFDITKGLSKCKSKEPYDIKIHSESLDYVFKLDWGYDTLTVNGRFEASLEGFAKMSKNFGMGPLNNTGRKVGLSLLADTEIIGKFMEHLGGFTKKMKNLNKAS